MKKVMVVVYGVPPTVDQAGLVLLVQNLQIQIAFKLCRVEPDEVVVFFNKDGLDYGLGEELVCFIHATFEGLGGPKIVSQRAAEAAKCLLSTFVTNHLPECKEVGIITNRINLDVDSFVSWRKEEKK